MTVKLLAKRKLSSLNILPRLLVYLMRFFFQTSVNDIFFFKQVLMTYLTLLRGVAFRN